MTQYELPAPINPLTTSGSTLADILSGAAKWRDALESLHKGASRPVYAQGGMLWIDDSAATAWKLYVYDGAQDIFIGELDLTTGELVSEFAERFGRFNLLRWTTTNPQFGTDNIFAAIYDPASGNLICVGQGVGPAPGSYSADGITWTAIAAGQLGGTGAANYGLALSPTLGTQGRIVSVGTYTGTVNGRYSDNGGVAWTAIASGQLNQSVLWGAAWSPTLNLFVAVGAPDGVVLTNSYTSSNGIAWSAIPFPVTGQGTLYAAAWCGDRFVIGGNGNAGGQDIFYSTDGVNWTPVVAIATASLAYSPKLGIIVAGTFTSGTIQYSTDGGANWTSVIISGITGTISAAAWLPKFSHFIIGSLAGAGQIAISPDGVNWEVVNGSGLTSSVLAAAEHTSLERAIVAGFGGALSHTP